MAKYIERYPDDEQRRRIMDFVMAAGQTLLENGAEVFRVEQTMQIMAASYHLREFQVYVLTNGIFASAGTAEISEVRNIPNRTMHLGRVAALNALSREIAAGALTLAEAEDRLASVRRMPVPSGVAQVAASAVGALCFSMLFGGSVTDGVVAGLAGAALGLYLLLCAKHGIKGMFQKLTGAAMITLLCILACSLVAGNVDYAVIGALMILTPGVAFTMSIRDFVRADYLSGTIRMIDALLVGGSIACGAGLVLGLYAWFTGVPV